MTGWQPTGYNCYRCQSPVVRIPHGARCHLEQDGGPRIEDKCSRCGTEQRQAHTGEPPTPTSAATQGNGLHTHTLTFNLPDSE